MKLQLLKEKIKRYIKILRHYGFKLTITYYLGQQSEEKYFNFRKKMILNFVYNLREKADINNIIDMDDMVERDFPKIVWTMWQQGEAQMPETVKASIKTIKAFAERNECEFYLLCRYGGIWMDSTLFVSSYTTIDALEGDFFTLNHPPLQEGGMGYTVGDFKWSGFFLAGKKGKSYFKNIRDLYVYYVRKYPIFIDYLIMDYFILSEYNVNRYFRELVDKIPILESAENLWFLRDHANDIFDEQEWDNVLKTTPIMKTTYKINEKELIPQTYLYKLYHDELNE